MRPDAELLPRARYPWRIFWVLLLAGVVGGVAAIPYLLRVFAARFATAAGSSMPLSVVVLMQSLQIALVLGVAIGFGLVFARKVGLPMPLLDAWLYGRTAAQPFDLGAAVIGGAVVGITTTLGLYVYLAPQVAGWPKIANVPIWMRLLSALYSGIDEELLIRFFIFGLVLWLVQKIRHSPPRNRTAFWIANWIVALLFGLIYLWPAAGLFPITLRVVVVFILFDGFAGLILGYLVWYHGLEAAMIAHFLATAIAVLVGPIFSG